MPNETKETVKPSEYSQQLVSLILQEMRSFESDYITLADGVKFSHYQTVRKIITHQNGGFMNPLAPGQKDDRQFKDIITAMIETNVSNQDVDVKDIVAYTDSSSHIAHQYYATLAVRRFLMQVNHGIVINENQLKLIDEGNLVVRKIDDDARIYKAVLPQNLYVIDQTAETLEDTAVIERDFMSQSELRKMKGWTNKAVLFEYCNFGDKNTAPFYQLAYRYGELSLKMLGMIKQEIFGETYEEKEEDDDTFVQCLAVMAEAKKGKRGQNKEFSKGVVTFIEQLTPETINVTKSLTYKKYKPYDESHFGKYNGRWWRQGYREVGFVYQDRDNEICNQLRDVMKIASKIIFHSTDSEVAGKNILSAIKNGQIIQAKDLNVLNNQFPNLTLFAEQRNQNIADAKEALKAFEVASGESQPSSTSATAIAVQNQAIGRYNDRKREVYCLFLASVFKRWVLPVLDSKIDEKEAIEIVGDPSFVDEIIDAYLDGWMIDNYLKIQVMQMTENPMGASLPTQQEYDQIREIQKQHLLKRPKLYMEAYQDFLKETELYIAFDPSGEAFNKQARVSNILQLLQYEANPAIQANPEAMDDLRAVKGLLGLPVKRNKVQPQQMPGMQGNQNNQAMPGSPMPMKEQPATDQVMNNQ